MVPAGNKAKRLNHTTKQFIIIIIIIIIAISADLLKIFSKMISSRLYYREQYLTQCHQHNLQFLYYLNVKNKSARNLLNKRGPKIKPCGTPNSISCKLYELFTRTLCFLFDKQLRINFKAGKVKPHAFSFAIRSSSLRKFLTKIGQQSTEHITFIKCIFPFFQ